MLTESIAITGNLVPFVFSLANLAATQTDTAVPIPGAVANTYTMLFPGRVVALTAQLSAAITAGTLTVDFSIAGTAKAVDKTLATASTTSYRYFFNPNTYPIAAGATLGVTYTSNGSLDPTTSDLVVVVYVLYEGQPFV